MRVVHEPPLHHCVTMMAPYDPDKHHRRSIRLKGYDYTTQGAYFVTICVHRRACLLGEVMDGDLRLNAWGHVVAESWLWLADRYPYVALDSWVIMPNHFHGIIFIRENDRSPEDGSLTALKRKSLGRLNEIRDNHGAIFWQRDYWEHIIRNEPRLNAIRHYIQTNPSRWINDQLHPEALPNEFNRE